MKVNSFFHQTLIFLLGCLGGIHSFAYRPESAGDPHLYLRTKILKACWTTDFNLIRKEVGDWTNDYSYAAYPSHYLIAAAKNAAITSYPAEITGIHWEGFSICPSKPDELSSINLYLMNNLDANQEFIGDMGVSTMGNTTKKSASGFNLSTQYQFAKKEVRNLQSMLVPLLEKNAFKDVRLVKAWKELRRDLFLVSVDYTLAHEFGHVLGLSHEESRADQANDEDASTRYRFCDSKAQDDHQKPSTAFSYFNTSYDIFSIMSYCKLDAVRTVQLMKFFCAQNQTLDQFAINESTRHFIKKLGASCEFIQEHPLLPRTSERDLAGLSKLYFPKRATKFLRESKIDQKWVHVLNEFTSDWTELRKFSKRP